MIRDPDKVFKVERLGDTLIVLPQGPTLNFQYQEVHLESNSLQQIVDDPQLVNAVVDLKDVKYLDSLIINALLRVLAKTKRGGGTAVFCNGTDDMQEILKCIKIGKLWPHHETREKALQSLQG